ncbi:hypothetical protein B0H11DRAFT_1377871 [Mycena galericulata]|nr:hypothetical protein B0H11DRAFT_1377871 [Mycena galericulata]
MHGWKSAAAKRLQVLYLGPVAFSCLILSRRAEPSLLEQWHPPPKPCPLSRSLPRTAFVSGQHTLRNTERDAAMTAASDYDILRCATSLCQALVGGGPGGSPPSSPPTSGSPRKASRNEDTLQGNSTRCLFPKPPVHKPLYN